MTGEPWRLVFIKSAEGEIKRLPDRTQRDLEVLIDELREDPDSMPEAIALRGYREHYRVRFGEGDRYRLIYRIDRPRRTLMIWRVRHRADAYIGMRDPGE